MRARLSFLTYALAAAILLAGFASMSASEAAPVQAAPAAQPAVAMAARGGYGDEGFYLIGELFPIHVTLANPAGGPSMRVRVEVDSKGDRDEITTGIYGRDVDLPSPSRKEVTLYAYSGGFTHSLEVRLLQGGRVINRASVKLTPQRPEGTALVGVLSSEPTLLNMLRGEAVGHIERPLQPPGWGASPGSQNVSAHATVVHMRPEDIPAVSVALDNLGALVIDDVDTNGLQAEQRQAITSWVARGGTLIAAGRAGGAGPLTGVQDLLPVTLSSGGTRSLSGLRGLSDLVATPITLTTSVIVPDASLRSEPGVASRLLASEGGVPLAAMRDIGKGQVVYLALSPSVAPLKGWDGTVPLFQRLLAEHPVRQSFGAYRRYSTYAGYYPGPGKIFDTYGNLFDLPALDLPDPSVVGLFLLIYILVVAPINFIVLRRMRRPELAWLTTPALVVLFSVAAYLLGYQTKGGELLAVRANLVRSVDGLSHSDAAHFLGLFSPMRGNYRLELPGDSTVAEVSAYGYSGDTDRPTRVSGGDPTIVSDVLINTWTLKAFMAENTVDAGSPLEADLRLGDNVIEGTVRNRTNEPLQDVALIRGNEVQHIGYIAPGQRAQVKLPVSLQPFSSSSSPDRLLPRPNGISQCSNLGGYPGPRQANSDEQRAYCRKVELLSTGLEPLVSAEPPDDLTVLAVAWGPGVPSGFAIPGRTARSEEANLWTAWLQVAGPAPEAAALKMRPVPFSVYAPGNSPQWLAAPDNPTIALNPYADVVLRLPPGTRPTSLTFNYQKRDQSSPVDLLAYNPNTGGWDRLAELENDVLKQLPITDPARYTGPAGDVTLRLQPRGGEARLSFFAFDFALNQP